MKIDRTGFILYVRKYADCVAFYQTVLGLEIQFQNEDLTCFDFFGTYLMVEQEDREDYLELEVQQPKNFSCLRMNVADVRLISEAVKEKNIEVDYQEHSWGIVAKFKDPDGNLIAFKDSKGFEKQIESYSASL